MRLRTRMLGDMNYDEVIEYIREYNLGSDNPSHYDLNGVVHFMLAAPDNLRTRAAGGELEEIGYSMTDEQRIFLKMLAEYSCRVSDIEIETQEH